MRNIRTSPTLANHSIPTAPPCEPTTRLLLELGADLRRNRIQLLTEWLRCIREAHLLITLTKEEILARAISVYNNYVRVLETGSVEAVEAYAPDLSKRVIPRGVQAHEVVGIVLLFRDVLARALFPKYHEDFVLVDRILPRSVEVTLPPLGEVILRPEEQADPPNL